MPLADPVCSSGRGPHCVRLSNPACVEVVCGPAVTPRMVPLSWPVRSGHRRLVSGVLFSPPPPPLLLSLPAGAACLIANVSVLLLPAGRRQVPAPAPAPVLAPVQAPAPSPPGC